MTIPELYSAANGSYEDARSRLMNDRLIEKFVLKFVDDSTMRSLMESVEAGNVEESFRYAHTLKGVSANLGFTDLTEKAHDLTEQLRPCTAPADDHLYERVLQAYTHTIKAVFEYKNAKGSAN